MRINEDNYVELMKRGNEKALWYFIENYGWIVKSIVHKKMAAYADEQEACMNDVFFAIWENVKKYDSQKAAFTTWVAAVTKYRVLNYMRNLKKQCPCLEMQDIEGCEIAGEEDVQTDIYCYDDEQEFLELLSCLSEQDREIFIKLYRDEMSHEEISRSMGMKKEVLYNRISRAKKKIRKHMKEDMNERYL